MKAHRSLTLLLGLLTALPAMSQEPVTCLGTLTARGRDASEGRLRLASVTVDATPAGDEVETRVEHVFQNEGADRLEGEFRFVLPDDARLIGLAMDVNGKLEEGAIVEREKARRIFQTVVDQMRDPALLEWDGSANVKLRVFPIEPFSRKRVVVRFLAPLTRSAEKFHYTYPLTAPEGQSAAVLVRYDGRLLLDVSAGRKGGISTVSYLVPAAHAPTGVHEQKVGDATFLAVRVSPDWAGVPAAARSTSSSKPRLLLLLVDTSRSALEAKPLVLASVRALLSALDSSATFALVAADITCRDFSPDFAPRAPATIDAALAFLREIEADGATDLAALFRHAGQLVARVPAKERDGLRIVYLGDGTPTWGLTDPKQLANLFAASFEDVPFHVLAFGRAPSLPFLRGLAGLTGGLLKTPRTLNDVTRFAEAVSARPMKMLRAASVKTPGGTVALLRGGDTLLDGDDVEALFSLTCDEPPPSSVTLRGLPAAGPVTQTLTLEASVHARHVATRWAALEIARLEEKARKQRIGSSLSARATESCRGTPRFSSSRATRCIASST